MVDVSFLLPTLNDRRPNEKFCHRVVKSIQEIKWDSGPKKFTYEILVYSPLDPEIEGVTWIKEEETVGSVAGYNKMYKMSKGRIVHPATDGMLYGEQFKYDVILRMIVQERDFILMIPEQYTEDGQRVESLATKLFNIPLNFQPDKNYTNFYSRFSDITKVACARFPVITRNFIEDKLGGVIYPSVFKARYIDHYMAFYFWLKGCEKIKELTNCGITAFPPFEGELSNEDYDYKVYCALLSACANNLDLEYDISYEDLKKRVKDVNLNKMSFPDKEPKINF